MNITRFRNAASISVIVLGCVAAPAAARSAAPRGGDKVFEANITKDLNMASGEPEIAVDPNNPKNLAIVEFTLGSEKRPAWKYNPVAGSKTEEEADESMRHLGRVQISNDGGNTWRVRPAPAYSRDHSPGGGDPMIEAGPNGALYVASEPFPKKLGQRGDTGLYTFVIAASSDWGKTFGAPQLVGTPVNRPFIKVDQSTGKVYSASSGSIDPATGALNKRTPAAIMDRWLVVWQPQLKGHSEPRRFGGPDFGVMFGTHVASHGVVATTFVLNGAVPGMGLASVGGSSVPESLRPIIKDGTTSCSFSAPCLFFQTSRDDGLHWIRHKVPVPDGLSGLFTYLASDEGRPGRYAIGMVNKDGRALQVVTTDDYGETWSPPSVVVNAPPPPPKQDDDPNASMIARMQGTVISKPWMAYGPSGVLGFMWKQRRDDVPGPSQPPQSPVVVWGPGFDVYAGISCDGGRTWQQPIRVNAQTSPRGPSAQDDLSYIALDKEYAHLVWGDRRDIMKIKNEPMGAGGIQTYYGRVPFSVATGGAQCGRK